MAHWKDTAVTNEGVEMLNEWMAGRNIKVVAAYGGTGTVDPELLEEQTGLVDMRQKLYILGEENDPKGKTVQLQVHNAEVMADVPHASQRQPIYGVLLQYVRSGGDGRMERNIEAGGILMNDVREFSVPTTSWRRRRPLPLLWTQPIRPM